MKSILVLSVMMLSGLTALAQGKVLSETVNGENYKFSEVGFTDKAAATQFCKDLDLSLVVGEDILGLAISAAIEDKEEIKKAVSFEIYHEGKKQSSGIIGWLSDADSVKYAGADVFSIEDGKGMSSETFKLKEVNEELKTVGIPELSVRAICK